MSVVIIRLFIVSLLWHFMESFSYKHIIFDVGGVLLQGTPEELLHDIIASDPGIARVLRSRDWDLWNKGLITEKRLVQTLSKSFNKESVETLVAAYLNPHRPFIQETWHIAQTLKQSGYDLYILSNLSLELYHTFIQSNATRFALFDGMLFSCQAHVAKPDIKIYTLLLKKYNLHPTDCIFIDDVPKNVYAAHKLGITGIIYKQHCLQEELHQVGITINNS